MITSYKNRNLDFGRPVSVYRNLTLDCWSIKQGGVVVAHATKLWMTTEKFKVNLKSRDKGLTEGKKYVHAFLVGFLHARQNSLAKMRQGESIGYNPVYAGHFYHLVNGYKYPVLEETKVRVFLNEDRKILLLENQKFA